MPTPNVRVGGSGFTVFQFKGTTLAYCQTIQDTAPAPVAQAVPVQSITDKVPTEIVTARALGPGTLRLTMYDQWNENVWQTLPGFGSARDLLDVFDAQVRQGSITCQRVIKKPNGANRVKAYYKCMITDIDDGEQVNIATMTMPKGFTVMYASSRWIS